MTRRRPATLPITLGELVRVDPLAAAGIGLLADPAHAVERVVLAETFERLRKAAPHSLVVLHAEAATGGWSLAAALHLAWERNASGIVVPAGLAGHSTTALAHRLHMSLLLIDDDPVDVALQLAGQVSAPDAARALRQATCAERLAEQTNIRGVLGVLNRELDTIPVALVVGETAVAGRSAAIALQPNTTQVSVEISGPGDQPWAHLVAAVPAKVPAVAAQVEALMRLARPSLLAAWAQTRLTSRMQAAREQAAFGLLRRLATDPPAGAGMTLDADVEAPPWSSELGWQVEGNNRAVWLAGLRGAGPPPEELTHLLRSAWQRGRPTWPLVAEGDGWVSWQSGADPEDLGPLRRALAAFHDTALGHQLVFGVGRAHQGVAGLMRSVAEARLAAHVARDGGSGSIQWFDQVGPRAALAWVPVADVAHVAELCLGPLMSAKDREALVATVLAVLDCGGSSSQASQLLGVHRNTVLGRIARARQLGLTFDDPRQRLAAHVICYALESLSDA